jgi:DNA polymerase III alpha subunit (gram-positive type)
MRSSIVNYICFDLETGGLSSEKNSIIEIACCGFNHDLKDVKEFESGVMQIYDNREINQEALDANKITREQIAKGVDPRETIEDLCRYFTSMKVGNSKPVLCGHNIDRFDIPFLDNCFTFFKKDLSKFVNVDFTIDTMWWARMMWAEQTNFKLGTCCEVAKIELIDAHRAISDTRANAQLVKYFLRNLKSESGAVAKESRSRAKFQF